MRFDLELFEQTPEAPLYGNAIEEVESVQNCERDLAYFEFPKDSVEKDVNPYRDVRHAAMKAGLAIVQSPVPHVATHQEESPNRG